MTFWKSLAQFTSRKHASVQPHLASPRGHLATTYVFPAPSTPLRPWVHPRLRTFVILQLCSKRQPVLRDVVGLARTPQPNSLEVSASSRICHQVSLWLRDIANTVHFRARPSGAPSASSSPHTLCKPCIGSWDRGLQCPRDVGAELHPVNGKVWEQEGLAWAPSLGSHLPRTKHFSHKTLLTSTLALPPERFCAHWPRGWDQGLSSCS